MFGFLSPSEHSREYRTVYARSCQHQRQHDGLLSLPFLSYEAVFLYGYWLDATGVGASDLPEQRCCRLRPLPLVEHVQDQDVGRFLSALTLLLVDVKLQDDERDARSRRARLARSLLGTRIRSGRKYFASLDPAFEPSIAAFIDAHVRLERGGELMPLDSYVKPTADAFAYVFSLLARLLPGEQHARRLQTIGSHVGSAIIAFDCANDWSFDRAHGHYNPLPDDGARATAYACARDHITAAERLCVDAFGESSVSVRILSDVSRGLDFSHDIAPPDRAPAPLTLVRKLKWAAGSLLSTSPAFAQSSSSKSDGDACLGCCMILACIGCIGAVKGKLKEKGHIGGKPYERREPGCLDC